jgi:hypothetical protein
MTLNCPPRRNVAEELIELILTELHQREEGSGQVREFNYVFEITTADTETGEIIMDHEYRTLASDEFLSDIDAYEAMEDLIADRYGAEAGG